MPLNLTCSASAARDAAVDLLVVAVVASDSVASDATVAALDRALDGGLGRAIRREEYKGKKEQTLELDTLGRLPAQRIMLIGLGEQAKLSASDYRTTAARASRAANATKAHKLGLALPGRVDADIAQAVGEGLLLGAYRFTKYFTGERKPKAELTSAVLVVEPKTPGLPKLRQALSLGAKIGRCIYHARDLINEPANELTPSALADYASRVARENKLTCRVFDHKQLAKMGAKLILAVGQGSVHEPRLVHITYKPAKATRKRLVVVGKGLTFDSGGLCIKPAAGMGEMKSDMAGAANVVAFMAAIAELKPAVEVHGILGIAENMPGGNAYRPGDVFGSLDGKTVEIVNTDAEGRLVLADALAYARKLEPQLLVCNATLTGAIVVALGQRCSAYYATDDDIAATFGQAAKDAGEQFWRMPLLEDMHDQLKSDIADLKHTGDRWGGSITAALFLRDFVGDTPFIHCDIAGPALLDKPHAFYTKGGSGQAVLTFLRLAQSM